MNASFFTNPDAWFQHANNIRQTDELLAFYRETLRRESTTPDFFEEAGMMDIFFTLSDHLTAEK
jgi:hypothetical protein